MEAGVRAALAAEGLDFDALSSAASHHGANAHAAPKAADGFELNGRKLLFDASELLAVTLLQGATIEQPLPGLVQHLHLDRT